MTRATNSGYTTIAQRGARRRPWTEQPLTVTWRWWNGCITTDKRCAIVVPLPLPLPAAVLAFTPRPPLAFSHCSHESFSLFQLIGN